LSGSDYLSLAISNHKRTECQEVGILLDNIIKLENRAARSQYSVTEGSNTD